MTYKAGDLVYFDGDGHKGVGEIVSIRGDFHLVRSTQIVGGHTGAPFVEREDSKNSWWYYEENLKPFTKKEGQRYKVIGNDFNDFEIGDIVTLSIVGETYGVSYYTKGDVVVTLYDIDHPGCEVEFCADAEEHKENEMFTKEDLKVGYLVKLRGGRSAHVVATTQKGMCLNYEDAWSEVKSYHDNLANVYFDDYDIVEVYGFTSKGHEAHKFEVGDRKLLWKREGVKEMTVEDIQKELGYKIKVVE